MKDLSQIEVRICNNCIHATEICTRTATPDNPRAKARYLQIPEWIYCGKKHQPYKFCEAICCPSYIEDNKE